MHTQTDQSCVGDDGEVSYQPNSGAANANGKSETTTNSGIDAACDSADDSDAEQNTAQQNDSTNGNGAASDAIPSRDTAPLVVINPPQAG